MRVFRHTGYVAGVFLLLCLWAAVPAPGQSRPASGPAPTSRTAPVTPAGTQPATQPAGAADRLKRAGELYMKGRYAEAAEAAKGALEDKAVRPAAACALARALAARGSYVDALGALDKVKEEAAGAADWQLARAEALAAVGRYAEALAAATESRRLAPAWAPAILAQGGLMELLGQKRAAIGVYATMERVVADASYQNDARVLTALGQILDRLAVLTGKRASEQAANILDNYLKKACEETDKGYWPGHVAVGQFLLGKHRSAQAAQYFRQALKLNEQCPEAMVGMGYLALQEWQFEAGVGAADRALKVNPVHDGAIVLKAVALMQARRFEEVSGVLEKLLAVNPNHVEALSLMAALHVRGYHPEKAKPFEERVAKVNPNCAELPLAIGQWLSAGRQHEQAEAYLKQATERAPELAAGWTELGLMYMQSGQEEQARKALDKAHALDDFRADVVNYLNLLGRMDKFLSKESPHFIVRADGGRDAVLLEQVSAYMERIYPEVCSEHGYEPKGKTLIEIFPTDLQFGLRITGRGWIGTVGACTGRVIAMVAPTKEDTHFGTHNWAAVLRHEFTHTVTLEATGNRIPHWLTEACAVRQQPDRRSYDALQGLAAATREGGLIPVTKLDWAFQRPKRQGDRALAYAQSEWILEYLIEKKTYAVLGRMLGAFRDGKSQAQMFQEVLGTTEGQFDKDFRAWARESVKKWGYSLDKPVPFEKAQKAAKARPDDADAHADLAAAWWGRGQRDLGQSEAAKAAGDHGASAALRVRGQEALRNAEAAARKALKVKPDNVKALGVLAKVLSAGKKYDEAAETARLLEAADANSRIAPQVLAEWAMKKQRIPEAIAALELLKLRSPMDPASYEELAKIYIQLGQPANALPDLMELHRRSLHSGVYARQIADICRVLGNDSQALEYYRQITYIDPYEASAYEKMASIHRDAERYDQAVAAINAVCLLQPGSADAWTKMAMMRYQGGRAAKDKAQLALAMEAADKALSIDPDSQAKTVKEYIQAALDELGGK